MSDSKSHKKPKIEQSKQQRGVSASCNADHHNDERSLPTSAPGDCNAKLKQAHGAKPKEIPVLRMGRVIYKGILVTIGSLRPETGGILLGPIGSNDITTWFFDQGGNCTRASYSPDHVNLKRKMNDEWLPLGIDMKGFVHSHPGRLDWLTPGDLAYISRLLDKNDDMTMFAAPIVIPVEFRMRPIVVLREKPRQPQEAKLVLF